MAAYVTGDLRDPTNLTGRNVSSVIFAGSYPVTQDHGVPGFRPDWYQYSGGLGWPSGYHMGLDIGVPKGTEIKSASYGEVVQAGWSDSYRPNPVTIVSTDDPATDVDETGSKIIYGHLWSAAVRVGQSVKPGDILGYSGEQTVAGTMNPDGSGPHLHLETRLGSPDATTGEFAVNPEPYLAGKIPAGDALTGGDPSYRIPAEYGEGTPGTDGGSSGGCNGWQIDLKVTTVCLPVNDWAARGGVFILGALLLVMGFAKLTGVGPRLPFPIGRK